MALTFNVALAELFNARIDELTKICAEELGSGGAGYEIARYRELVGWIRGMRESMDVLAEINKKLQER